jgi:ethanolaminephosphotransferase
MIIAIYIISGFYGIAYCNFRFLTCLTSASGASFWDTGVLTFLKVDSIPMITKLVPNIGLNELFMVFGGFGLAYNIVMRCAYHSHRLNACLITTPCDAYSYMNVRQSKRAKRKSVLRPLFSLIPFPIAALIQVLWLTHPTYNNSTILHSALFVPFLCAWGLQFAHQVGRMILAHICHTGFPWFHMMWLWSIVGALDANLPRLLGR